MSFATCYNGDDDNNVDDDDDDDKEEEKEDEQEEEDEEDEEKGDRSKSCNNGRDIRVNVDHEIQKSSNDNDDDVNGKDDNDVGDDDGDDDDDNNNGDCEGFSISLLLKPSPHCPQSEYRFRCCYSYRTVSWNHQTINLPVIAV